MTNLIENSSKEIKVETKTESKFVFRKVDTLVVDGFNFTDYITNHTGIINFINWDKLSSKEMFKLLPDEFVSKFKDKLIWSKICSDSDLSFDFLKEFKDYIYWDVVSNKVIKKDGGFDFLLEMKEKINWNRLLKTFNFTEDVLYVLFCELSLNKEVWKTLVEEQDLSDTFITDFFDEFEECDCWDLILDNKDLGSNVIKMLSKKSDKFKKAFEVYNRSGKIRYKITEEDVENTNCVFKAPPQKALRELLQIVNFNEKRL